MQSPKSQGEAQSNLSSDTFLAVPMVIQQTQIQGEGLDNNSAYQTYPMQRHVSFQNPQSNQRQEHRESIEEQELLLSKYSNDRKSIYMERDSYGFSNYQQSMNSGESHNISGDRDEEYQKLKLFQNEMDQIIQKNKGKFRLNRTRVSSDNMLDHIPRSKDSFKISPQFKPSNGSNNILSYQLCDILAPSPESPRSLNVSYTEINSPALFQITPRQPLLSWSKVTLIVVTFVARLMIAAKLPAAHNKLKLFTKSYYDLIGDKGSSFKFFTKLGQMRQSRSFSKTATNKWSFYQSKMMYFNDKYIIEPTSSTRIYSMMTIYLGYIIGIFLITYESSFSKQSYSVYFFFVLVILDIGLQLNTAIFQNGKLVKNRLCTFKDKKMQLLQDLLVIIILLLILTTQRKGFGLFIIFRYFRVSLYNSELNYIAEFYFKQFIQLKLYYLVLQALLIGHMCACILQIFNENGEDWFQYSQSMDNYVASLSWSLLTILTIGSNSQVLTDTNGQVFRILVSLVSFLFLLSIIYQILLMINDFSSPQQQKILLILKSYKKRGLSFRIQYQIRKYYENQFDQQQKNYEDKRLWDQLSQDLREQISKDLYSKVIRTSILLTETCSEQCLDSLCTKFQFMLPERAITFLQKGILCDKLVFVLNGELTQIIQLPLENRPIRSYSIGAIDEQQFILQVPRPFNYIIKSEVQLAFIDQADFLDTIKRYPEDFERMAMQRVNLTHNQILMNKQQVQSFLRLQVCQNCDYRGHLSSNCPFVHLVLNNQLILKNFNINHNVDRKKFFRNDNQRFNSRLNKNTISITAISFSIAQKFHREVELTNELMNKLTGNLQQQQDESLFGDGDEKSQRTHLDRQFTSRQTDQFLQTLKSSQNTYGTNTQHQNSITNPIKIDNDRDSSFYSSGKIQQHKQNSINSIKVNVIKSSISSDHLLQQHDKLRISKQKASNTDSVHRPDRNKKLSYMSANPPNNPLQVQSLPPQQPLNQSTSIMQQTLNTLNHTNNQTYISMQQSTFSPNYLEEVDKIILQDQNPLSIPSMTALNSVQRTRVDFSECDKINNYKYFFPSYNFDLIAIRLRNHKKLQFAQEEKPTKVKFTLHLKSLTEKFIVHRGDHYQYSMK